MVFLPLMASEVERLAVMNVLPEPGFMDVIITTWWPSSNPSMNSRLVRTTRKASFMMVLLLGMTRSLLSVTSRATFLPLRPDLVVLRIMARGISPTKGALIHSRSLRPRTVVLNPSLTVIIDAGMARAAMSAMIMTEG